MVAVCACILYTDTIINTVAISSVQRHSHTLYRGGYGQERYEVLELQQLVAKEFKQLEDDRFAVIDGSQTVDEVSQEVYAVAEAVINKCHSESIPLGTLWEPPAFSVADTLQNSKTI